MKGWQLVWMSFMLFPFFVNAQNDLPSVEREVILLQFLSAALNLDSNQQASIEEVLYAYEEELVKLQEQLGRKPDSGTKRRYAELLQNEMDAIEEVLSETQQEAFRKLGKEWHQEAFEWWQKRNASPPISNPE
jgi:hypothetical protein